MLPDSYIPDVMAEIDIIKGNIPEDSGVPAGDFVYSDYNSSGSTTKQQSNITVGDGTMLQQILKDNGSKVKSGLDKIYDELKNNTLKQVEKMASYEKTFDTALGKVTTSINTTGANIEFQSKNIADSNKTLANVLNNKDMAPKISNNIDVSPLAEPTKEIAKGVQSTIDKNTKVLEHLDFQSNGNDNLVSSDGTKIIPREAIASFNAEKAMETSDMNRTTMDELTDFVGDMFGFVGDSLGGDLGEDNEVNPMVAFLSKIEKFEKLNNGVS